MELGILSESSQLEREGELTMNKVKLGEGKQVGSLGTPFWIWARLVVSSPACGGEQPRYRSPSLTGRDVLANRDTQSRATAY